MANNNLSVSFAQTNGYAQYDGKNSESTQKTTQKAVTPVPVVPDKKVDAEAPIKGFDLERTTTTDTVQSDVNTEGTTTNGAAQNYDAQAEVEPETSVSENVQVENSPQEDKTDDEKDTQKPADVQAASKHAGDKKSTKTKKGFTNPKSTVSGSYTKLLSLGNASSKGLPMSEQQTERVAEASDFVEVMEDIDAAGQKHIDFLTTELPESGMISGSASVYLERGQGEKSQTYQADVVNSWQNKGKTFGIVAGASFGYQNTHSTGEEKFDINFTEQEPSNNEVPAKSDFGSKTVKTGSVVVDARLKTKEFIYGAGVNSVVTEDNTQVHDQYITAKNLPTGISGNLMRRTVVSKNSETGESTVKSRMKLKLSLFDRNDSNISQATYNSNITVNSAMDSGEENELRKSVMAQADELGQKTVGKNGRGFDLDFEYDNTKCGFISEYGFGLTKKDDQDTNFVIAPVLGVYDYNPPTDESTESLEGILGVASKFEKNWSDGQSVNASLYAVNNRVVANGHKPKDTQYVVFNGGYVNPKIKFSAGVNAGLVRTNAMNLAYAETSVNYSMKNVDLGLEAGCTKFNAFGKSDYDYQVALKCKYNIPYKTKK